jgi:hypothetical protein
MLPAIQNSPEGKTMSKRIVFRSKSYVARQDSSVALVPAAVKLIALVFDATGSMSSVWQEAKTNIRKLVNRQRELTPQARFGLIAYRDYCCAGDGMFEFFGPSADARELAAFLDSIECGGGGGEFAASEAALDELLRLKPSLAMLVGDTPPHGVRDEMMNDKDYREIASQFGAHNIPIYTVGVGDDELMLSSFEEIAQLSGGKVFRMDEVDELTDLLSVATASRTRQLDQLADILKRENGGQVTARQQMLLLKAAKD